MLHLLLDRSFLYISQLIWNISFHQLLTEGTRPVDSSLNLLFSTSTKLLCLLLSLLQIGIWCLLRQPSIKVSIQKYNTLIFGNSTDSLLFYLFSFSLRLSPTVTWTLGGRTGTSSLPFLSSLSSRRECPVRQGTWGSGTHKSYEIKDTDRKLLRDLNYLGNYLNKDLIWISPSLLFFFSSRSTLGTKHTYPRV